MTNRIVMGSSLTMVLFLGGTLVADELKSGPQVGQTIPGAFNPLNVTGSDAGQKRCLV
ncbi:MAG: hypothetical protein ACK4RK_11585 [Gemmataceae bacterium]